MKGIGHFLTGMAVATCFPEAMRATLQDNSLVLLLGGAFGLLPDTLDFRLGRYFWQQQHKVTPDLTKLDARPIAETVARAIDEAALTRKPVHVKLNTLKVSANYHRTYSIWVDPKRQVVRAEIGPLKTMGQAMGGGGHLPRSLPVGGEHGELAAEVPFKAKLNNPYHAETNVAIFSGPDFAFVPVGDEVRMDFIPWHRTWAHSPFLGLALGLLGYLFYSLLFSPLAGTAAAFTSPMALTVLGIITLSFWGHTLVDQFGVLGSVLLWPFSDKRSSGFKWTHAVAVLGNITLNLCCVAVIFWNMIVHHPDRVVVMPWAASLVPDWSNPAFYLVSLANFAAYFVAAPLLVIHLGARLYRRCIPAASQPDVADEMKRLRRRGAEQDEEGLDGPGEFSGD
jgi:hypothetical protein